MSDRMTRTQQQVAILAGLGVVAALIYGRGLVRAPSSKPAVDHAASVAPDQPTQPDQPLRRAYKSATRAQQLAHAGSLAWGRDPFLRAGGGDVPGLTLSGILWDPSDAIAIINGQMLHVGQECDGFLVVEIQPDRVTVSDGVTTYQLSTAP